MPTDMDQSPATLSPGPHDPARGVKPHPRRHHATPLDVVSQAFTTYFWVIFKNVIGWILVISALPVGIAVPGPGGIPMFLIGFALVTFPGKRKLTSRVMRGRGLPLEAQVFTILTAFISIGLTVACVWIIQEKYEDLFEYFNLSIKGNEQSKVGLTIAAIGVGAIALLVTWAVTHTALRFFNWLLRGMPLVRRKVRPWLKRHGVKFLPSRRKREQTGEAVVNEDEILEFHERHHTRLRTAWTFLKPWLRRMVALGITLFIFVQMVKPLITKWSLVQDRVDEISMWRFALAAIMFAAFLYVFRALAWRRILTAFGHKLPVAAATRIWATSELARYLPGAIWQVWGRIYLIKPYGVSGTITSTTQILELCVFLLANVLVASTCLLFYVAKIQPEVKGWLYTAMALAPTLAIILHPKVFYGVLNPILTRLGKPSIIQRLRGKSLVTLLARLVVGLLWQSLAVWLITAPPLGLKIDHWWVVAGAYCLAWCAGFLAVWAPGGLGVRELVFVLTMQMVLPEASKEMFSDPQALAALLVFLGFVLRLWTILGEALLTSIAYAADLKGALNHPDAPGRVGRAAVGVD